MPEGMERMEPYEKTEDGKGAGEDLKLCPKCKQPIQIGVERCGSCGYLLPGKEVDEEFKEVLETSLKKLEEGVGIRAERKQAFPILEKKLELPREEDLLEGLMELEKAAQREASGRIEKKEIEPVVELGGEPSKEVPSEEKIRDGKVQAAVSEPSAVIEDELRARPIAPGRTLSFVTIACGACAYALPLFLISNLMLVAGFMVFGAFLLVLGGNFAYQSMRRPPRAAVAVTKQEVTLYACPICKTSVSEEDERCPGCGAYFENAS